MFGFFLNLARRNYLNTSYLIIRKKKQICLLILFTTLILRDVLELVISELFFVNVLILDLALMQVLARLCLLLALDYKD